MRTGCCLPGAQWSPTLEQRNASPPGSVTGSHRGKGRIHVRVVGFLFFFFLFGGGVLVTESIWLE